MTTYTARTVREEGWWTVTVDEIEGLFTQTRRLDQIPAMVRDALELFPEVEESPESAQINVVAEGEILPIAERARELTHKAKEVQEEASAAMAQAAHELAASGLPYRDIGYLLGVSHQYAQRLANA